jgi:hypothetical protein
VDAWRGRIALNTQLNGLFVTALNSDDLDVRVSAIEVDLAALNLEKTPATVDALEPESLPRDAAAWRQWHASWNR